MKKKLRIGILFGGRSGEHEVSLLSAASVLKAIDRKRYDVVPIAIDKQGRWLCGADAQRLLDFVSPLEMLCNSESGSTLRYERRADMHEAFLALGCCLICYRRLNHAL